MPTAAHGGRTRRDVGLHDLVRARNTTAVAAVLLLVAACGGSPSYETDMAPAAMSPAAQLGERIFSDTSLSASRAQACATCHVAARGRFKSLKDALTFYVQRDTNPEKFYPQAGGVVQKFDDLPDAYRGNVNRSEAPYNRNPGDAPALSDSEIDDVIAFLATLTDGFTP